MQQALCRIVYMAGYFIYSICIYLFPQDWNTLFTNLLCLLMHVDVFAEYLNKGWPGLRVWLCLKSCLCDARKSSTHVLWILQVSLVMVVTLIIKRSDERVQPVCWVFGITDSFNWQVSKFILPKYMLPLQPGESLQNDKVVPPACFLNGAHQRNASTEEKRDKSRNSFFEKLI